MKNHRLLPKSRGAVTRGRRLLLVTGTPGTGKRPLAGYLELQRGFFHLDLDSRDTRTRLLRAGEDELRRELAAVTGEHAKVVVTWTFTSETQLAYVETIRSLGFEWIWMDSDRGAAYDALISRDSTVRPPRVVDGFEDDGTFRALEDVTGELRRRRPLPRARVRVPSLSLQRPAWAGVAAFAAAAAAAGAAYVAGVFDQAQPARVALAHRAHVPRLPVDGVFVPGKSLAGVQLGDTAAAVRDRWGSHYTVCRTCNPMTWFYFDSATSDAGVAVAFRHGAVTAVFTLGSPDGWHTSDGVRVGELLRRFNDPKGKTTACSGYGAISTRSGGAVTSILTIGQAVYGFALTRPSEPVCH